VTPAQIRTSKGENMKKYGQPLAFITQLSDA